MTLDNKYNQIFSFEENALYVEMYPMGDKVENEIVKLNNIIYFRFWDSSSLSTCNHAAIL